MSSTKVCAKCGLEKPLSDFRRHKGHGDGFDSRCKLCMRNDALAKKGESLITQYPGPKTYDALDPKYRKMTKQTVEGFALFFNEFSGKELPPHGYTWVRAALANPRLLLNVPPRHAKTTIMAIWFVIWQYACNRNTQVIIISKTTALGEKVSRKIAHELEANVELNMAFGRFRSEDLTRPWRVTKGELEIAGKDLHDRSGDLSLQIRGSGQAILGMEADWVIADDITDRRVARSEVEREGEWDFFLGDVLTRLAPDGKAFCIGQRVHSEDIYGRLGRLADDDGTPAWHMERTPAILDEEEGLVLWPGLWPYEKMVDKRKSLGSALFQCMYQQAPEVAGEFVPRWWLEGNGTAETPGCFDRDRNVGRGWKKAPEQSFIPVTRVLSVDPSPTAFAGMMVADVIWLPQNQFFNCAIVDIRRDKMGMTKMMEAMNELVALYRPQVVIFEENSAKWLHEDPAWHRVSSLFAKVIWQRTTKWNKHEKELGIWSLAGDFEQGRIRFPYADRADREAMEVLVNEILAYPNGSTDDVLMALWFIKAHYRELIPRDNIAGTFDNGLIGRGAWDMSNSGAWSG